MTYAVLLTIKNFYSVDISRGKFLESHAYFVGDKNNKAPDYFEYAGIKLADLLLKEMISEPILVK